MSTSNKIAAKQGPSKVYGF
jgi:hypothetical protein